MNFKTKIGKLNNGIQYILSDNPNTQSVAFVILVRYGAGFDPLGKSGTAHLLEHLVFKGTDKRPSTKDIMSELDSIGCKYNAFTSKTFTGYYTKSAYNYLENCMDILTDIIHTPKFLSIEQNKFKDEFEQEKKIVLQELLSIRDQYSRYNHELIEKNIFVSPINRNSEDDIEDIYSISINDIIETHKKYYCSENIIVSIHGNLQNLDKTEKLMEKYFGNFRSSFKNSHLFQTSKNRDIINYIDIFRKSNIEKCHLSLTFPNRGYEDKTKYYLTELLGLIFVDLTSGRLFQKIREDNALIYNINSSNFYYDYQGYFSIQTNTNLNNIDIVTKKIVNEINEVCLHGLEIKEFEIGVNNYISKILLDSEDANIIAMYNVYELFYNPNNFLSYFKVIDIIKNFTIDSINNFIKEFFSSRPVLTVIKND